MGAITLVDADAGLEADDAAHAKNVIPDSFPFAE
jgi:hypothetical protein